MITPKYDICDKNFWKQALWSLWFVDTAVVLSMVHEFGWMRPDFEAPKMGKFLMSEINIFLAQK